jgi:hypothetical protein
MLIRKKLNFIGVAVVVAAAAWFAWPYVLLSYAVSRAFHEQGVQNEAAKPLFEAVVAKRLKVGDSLEHVKEVLNYAGLGFDVVREPFPSPMVQSIYRAGRWFGFTIHLELDHEDRVSKVDIHEYFTGP